MKVTSGEPLQSCICEQCGKDFYRNARRIEIAKHHFCGNKCKMEFLRGHRKKNYIKNPITEMVKLKKSQCQKE